MSDPEEPRLPSSGRAWAAWVVALIAGAFLGFFAHLWIHRLVRSL